MVYCISGILPGWLAEIGYVEFRFYHIRKVLCVISECEYSYAKHVTWILDTIIGSLIIRIFRKSRIQSRMSLCGDDANPDTLGLVHMHTH